MSNFNRGRRNTPTETQAETVTCSQGTPYTDSAQLITDSAQLTTDNTERYSPLFVNIPSPGSSVIGNPSSSPNHSPLSLLELSPRWYSPIPSPEFGRTPNSAIPSSTPELSTYLPSPTSVLENLDFFGLAIPTIPTLRDFSQGAFHLLLEYFLDFFPTYSLPLPPTTIICWPGPINIPALRIAVENAGPDTFIPFITHHRVHPVLIPAIYIREFMFN
ncbi:uncharacterized protein LOC113563089 [Ooceraea biroi]|uniref:uncharacterized protein LOC113563089 n=1 Tax=Ooceraea biroi TaxID=2015173 RepID=UPI000F083668|nr:uncharacterized protein LOC113563089 [Ooceraea biroi]